jgi:hypothetical protein
MSGGMIPADSDGVIWLNWDEGMKLSRRLSVEQMGNVIREICEASESGVLRNGRLVRIDPPVQGPNAWEPEAKDGPHTQH